MTDAELTRLAAEKVMQWMPYQDPGVHKVGWNKPTGGWTRYEDFHPLTDWRAAGEIVEKMRELKYGPVHRNGIGGAHKENFGFWSWHQIGGCWRYFYSGLPLSPRAITIAALLAVGAITEAQLALSAALLEACERGS